MSNAVIQIKNFGPVKSGQFELNPLTIFLGLNNTGKSYCALLVYSIYQAILGRIPGTMPSVTDRVFSDEFESHMSKDWPKIRQALRSNRNICLSDFPQFTRGQLTEVLEESLLKFPKSIEISLQKYLQYDHPNELICKNLTHPRSMVIELKDLNGNSYLSLKVAPQDNKVHVSTSLSAEQYTLDSERLRHLVETRYPITFIMLQILSTSFQQLFSGFNDRTIYYLPAARSGTLQVWPLLGTAITESLSRLAGLYPIQLRSAPGITSDFMTTIYDLIGGRTTIPPDIYASRKDGLTKIIDFMEKEILEGSVGFARTGDLKTPVFYYTIPGLRLDLSRASSMVAELAPLDMLMKRFISPPYDTVVIDEPEAHLHPANQRKIAILIAKLVRNGVNVICTTHSHLFLHQISNLVLASSLSPGRKKRLGLSDSTLDPSDVGVYLFERKDSLVNIKPVPLTKAVGYAEGEYIKVYEELLEEYHEVSDQ